LQDIKSSLWLSGDAKMSPVEKLFYGIICNNLETVMVSGKLLLTLTYIFAFTSLAFSKEYYVSTTGDETNAGTIEKPFASLEGARNAIRELKRRQGLPKDGVTVFVRGGIYSLKSAFVLDEQDSGSKNCRISYKGYKNEKVQIIGGRLIGPGAFKPVVAADVLAGLDDSARGHVLCISLSALGVSDFGEHKQVGHALSVEPAPLELFFNDLPMTLARYPNDSANVIGKVIDKGSVPRVGDYSNRGGTFEYSDDRHAKWVGLDDVWLQGTFMHGYADDKIKVESIDARKRQVKLTTPHMYGIGSGRAYQQYVALNM